MSLIRIIAVVLVVAGNIIAVVKSIQANALPDAMFLVVDGAAILYVLSGVLG